MDHFPDQMQALCAGLIDYCKAELDQVKEENAKLRQTVKSLPTELEEARDRVHSQLDVTVQRLDALERSNEDKERQYEEQKQDITRLNDLVAQLGAKNMTLRSKQDWILKQNNDLLREIQKLKCAPSAAVPQLVVSEEEPSNSRGDVAQSEADEFFSCGAEFASPRSVTFYGEEISTANVTMQAPPAPHFQAPSSPDPLQANGGVANARAKRKRPASTPATAADGNGNVTFKVPQLPRRLNKQRKSLAAKSISGHDEGTVGPAELRESFPINTLIEEGETESDSDKVVSIPSRFTQVETAAERSPASASVPGHIENAQALLESVNPDTLSNGDSITLQAHTSTQPTPTSLDPASATSQNTVSSGTQATTNAAKIAQQAVDTMQAAPPPAAETHQAPEENQVYARGGGRLRAKPRKSTWLVRMEAEDMEI